MKCYGVWCTEVLTWPRGGRKVSRRIDQTSKQTEGQEDLARQAEALPAADGMCRDRAEKSNGHAGELTVIRY